MSVQSLILMVAVKALFTIVTIRFFIMVLKKPGPSAPEDEA